MSVHLHQLISSKYSDFSNTSQKRSLRNTISRTKSTPDINLRVSIRVYIQKKLQQRKSLELLSRFVLPNNCSFLRCDVHWIAWLDVECFVPRIDVWQCAIHTPFAQRMGVCLGTTNDFFVAHIACPHVRI